MTATTEYDPAVLARFRAEMDALARKRHEAHTAAFAEAWAERMKRGLRPTSANPKLRGNDPVTWPRDPEP